MVMLMLVGVMVVVVDSNLGRDISRLLASQRVRGREGGTWQIVVVIGDVDRISLSTRMKLMACERYGY